MTALPDFEVKRLISNNDVKIKGSTLKDVQPASVDIGPDKGDIYLTEFYSNKINDDYLSKYGSRRGSLGKSFIFEQGKTYILEGPHITLPDYLEGHIEQKSTTGRLGLFNEVLILDEKEGLDRTNYIPAGYDGPTFFRIENRAFPIELSSKDRIAQIRLSKKDTGFLSNGELKMGYGHRFGYYHIFGNGGVENNRSVNNNNLIPANDIIYRNTTLLTADTNIIFAQKKGVSEPIIYSKPESSEILDYWDIILNDRNMLDVPKKTLILSSSREVVDTGEGQCWKMAMKTEGFGIHTETHRAGFGDPSFRGRITCEIINHHKPLLLWEGQYLSHLFWEEMSDIPKNQYGDNNNYQDQLGPLPPKHFKRFNTVYDDLRSGELKPSQSGVNDIEKFLDELRKP